MDAASILLILVAAGVNFGWQPADDAPDALEYIVQVEPELLDALRHGEAVPIESNVPPDVGPIRKVSIVVGRGDLPRTTAGAINRTSNFAGERAWTPDRYNPAAPPAASSYDRYGPPPGVTNTAVGPPPSVIDRAQTAVTETGATLRDGVEAGIQAANQQLSRSGGQVVEATRDAGQEFGRQLQNWANDPAKQLQSTTNDLRSATERTLGTVGNQLQQASSPFVPQSGNTSPPPVAGGNRSPTNVALPPWPAAAAGTAAGSTAADNAATPGVDPTAAAGMTPTKTASGWTMIGPNVAPPPLLVPTLDTTAVTSRPGDSQSAAGSDGPQFPERQQPAAASNGANDWAAGWGTSSTPTPATISRNGNTLATENTGQGTGLVDVQPISPGVQNPQQAAGRADDLWAEADRWAQPPQSTTAAPGAQNANNVTASSTDAADWQLGGNRSSLPITSDQSNPAPLAGAVNDRGAAAIVDGREQPGTAPATLTRGAALPAAAEQPPWLPLLVVSLSLMGSLSANLFLGWSYMDARQKYRSLVRKTADTFRRAKAAAA